MYLDRRAAVAGVGLLPADGDARARDVRDQHRQPHVRIAPVRDASTNRATTPVTAFFAVGEGWHNNHHRYQRAARNGFYWWEFDPTWYVDPRDAAVGLAWDVQPVPERIYEEARAAKAKRAARAVPSIIDAVPLALELAEDAEADVAAIRPRFSRIFTVATSGR